jgi:hypothetical protein
MNILLIIISSMPGFGSLTGLALIIVVMCLAFGVVENGLPKFRRRK